MKVEAKVVDPGNKSECPNCHKISTSWNTEYKGILFSKRYKRFICWECRCEWLLPWEFK